MPSAKFEDLLAKHNIKWRTSPKNRNGDSRHGRGDNEGTSLEMGWTCLPRANSLGNEKGSAINSHRGRESEAVPERRGKELE